MNSLPIADIYNAERKRWYREEAPRRPLGDWMGIIAPYFIVIVFISAYLLSAPHTAAVAELITPGFGRVAPVMVELAILYTAFMKKLGHLQNIPVQARIKWLNWGMFGVAIITNLAGGLQSAASSVGVADYSAAQLFANLPTLPINTQAAIAVAILFAFVVPITCEVAGHGVATIAFEIRKQRDTRDDEWKKAESESLYRAIYDLLTSKQVPPLEARRIAMEQTAGYLSKVKVSQRSTGRTDKIVSVERPVASDRTAPKLSAGQSDSTRQLTAATSNGHSEIDKRTQAFAFLEANPDMAIMSVRLLQQAMLDAGIEIGRTTVNEVQQHFKRTSADTQPMPAVNRTDGRE